MTLFVTILQLLCGLIVIGIVLFQSGTAFIVLTLVLNML